MKEPVTPNLGASFLTGGLIAVGLLASTVVGTTIISYEWAPPPTIQREYIDSNRDGGTAIMSIHQYEIWTDKLNHCEDELAKVQKIK